MPRAYSFRVSEERIMWVIVLSYLSDTTPAFPTKYLYITLFDKNINSAASSIDHNRNDFLELEKWTSPAFCASHASWRNPFLSPF